MMVTRHYRILGALLSLAVGGSLTLWSVAADSAAAPNLGELLSALRRSGLPSRTDREIRRRTPWPGGLEHVRFNDGSILVWETQTGRLRSYCATRRSLGVALPQSAEAAERAREFARAFFRFVFADDGEVRERSGVELDVQRTRFTRFSRRSGRVLARAEVWVEIRSAAVVAAEGTDLTAEVRALEDSSPRVARADAQRTAEPKARATWKVPTDRPVYEYALVAKRGANQEPVPAHRFYFLLEDRGASALAGIVEVDAFTGDLIQCRTSAVHGTVFEALTGHVPRIEWAPKDLRPDINGETLVCVSNRPRDGSPPYLTQSFPVIVDLLKQECCWLPWMGNVSPHAIAIDGSGTTVGMVGERLWLLDLHSGTISGDLELPPDAWGLSLSDSASRIAFRTQSGDGLVVAVVDPVGGAEVYRTPPGHHIGFALSSDGMRLAWLTREEDHSARCNLADLSRGEVVASVVAPAEPVAVRVRGTTEILVVDSSLRIHSWATPGHGFRLVSRRLPPPGYVLGRVTPGEVALDHDGRRAAFPCGQESSAPELTGPILCVAQEDVASVPLLTRSEGPVPPYVFPDTGESSVTVMQRLRPKLAPVARVPMMPRPDWQ